MLRTAAPPRRRAENAAVARGVRHAATCAAGPARRGYRPSGPISRRGSPMEGARMSSKRNGVRWFTTIAAALLCLALASAAPGRAWAQAKPEGEMRWALYVTLSPMWLDPAEFAGLTPFWVLYAIHDAVVKPMP